MSVSQPTKEEADKIKHWRAEKAAIRERQTKLEAAKQVPASARTVCMHCQLPCLPPHA